MLERIALGESEKGEAAVERRRVEALNAVTVAMLKASEQQQRRDEIVGYAKIIT